MKNTSYFDGNKPEPEKRSRNIYSGERWFVLEQRQGRNAWKGLYRFEKGVFYMNKRSKVDTKKQPQSAVQ